jgi:DNA invertase Pin-like site-specific DNA recombinase
MSDLNLIGVIRLSSDEQAREGRAGLDRQRNDIEAIRKATGANIIRTMEVIESGTRVMDHRDFKQLFRDLSDPSVQGVACSNLDRLVRPDNFKDFGILDYFKANRKRIYTPANVIDPNTQSGFMESTIRAMFAGIERQIILERTSGGKERGRRKGKHIGPARSLARGVLYDKKTGTWRYDLDPADSTPRAKGHKPGDALLVRKMFELLVYEGLSWEAIAATVGGGWSYNGVRNTLRNPIWVGRQRYHSKCDGPVITARAVGKNGEQRKYRKAKRREDAYEVQVIEKGLISQELFDRAQEIISIRAAEHGKRKKLPRFLLASLLRCSCGKPWYSRAGSRRKGQRYRDYYFCSSLRSPDSCRNRTIQREALEQAITEIVTGRLLEVELLNEMLAGAKQEVLMGQPASVSARWEQEIASIEEQRQRLIDVYQIGTITRAEFMERVGKLDGARKALDVMYPAPNPVDVDVKCLVSLLAMTFAQFKHLPFSDQRSLLQRAVKRITISGTAIVSLTLSGGFLGDISGGVKLSPPSIRSYPQPEFSLAICTIRASSFDSIRDLPG